MSAQPVHEEPEDPRDPQNILRDLPEKRHEKFLAEYRAAVDAAHDPAGYRRLQNLLRYWAIKVKVYPTRPDYDEEVAAAFEEVESGTARTYDFWEAIEAERARRRAS